MTTTGRPPAGATRRGATVTRPLPVAWPTVLLLAACLAYADVFWVVSLREAAGAIERTSHPFAAWLRESTLLLPSYVVAVLVARLLCRRRGAAGLDRGADTTATALVLVALATAVGVLALAASSLYDYRLELALLEHASHAGCLDDCLDSQRAGTAGLQLSSVGHGSGIILLTNLVVVGWLVAAMGGRLRLDRPEGTRRVGSTSAGRPVEPWARVAAWSLGGAALVHVAVVPEHATEWPAAGVFFVALACAQAAIAVAVVRRPGRASRWAAVAVSLAALTVWLWSRTAGLPWGPEAGGREPAGLADLAVVVLQLATLLAVASSGRRQRRTHEAGPATDCERILLAALVAVTVVGLGGSGVGGLDVTGGDGHAASAAERPSSEAAPRR